MKIALAIRGLVRRPGHNAVDTYDKASVDWCAQNIQKLQQMFSQAGHEVTVFFCSWNVPNSKDLVLQTNNMHFVLLPQPSLEEAFRILPVEPIWFRDPSSCWHHTMTVYGTFAQSNAVMSAIANCGEKFDYICAARPDLIFSVTNINEWLVPDTFMVPAMNFVNFNDHFGIAPADAMIKIYTPTPQELIDTVTMSLDTESVLKNLIEKNGINISTNINITEYQLRDVNHLYLHKRDCGLL